VNKSGLVWEGVRGGVYGGKKTVGKSSQSEDGHFEINVGKR